jgi:predicted nucleic acid-binding protein
MALQELEDQEPKETKSRAVITLDSSALFALLNRRDPDHRRVKAALQQDRGPYLIPAAILGEIAFLVENRLGNKVMDLFLDDLCSGAYSLHCGDDDLPRARELARKYGDLPLGFTDAAVAACAEANGKRVLTLDTRDFSVIQKEAGLVILPD